MGLQVNTQPHSFLQGLTAQGDTSLSGIITGPFTVRGNISASNSVFGLNVPRYFYLDNNRAGVSGSFVAPLSYTNYFDASATLVLLPNALYEIEYSLFYSRNSTLPLAFALSSSPVVNHITVAAVQSPAGGFAANTGNAASALLGTGTISAQPGNLIPVLSTGTLVANVSYFTTITTQIQTSASNIPNTTIVPLVCAGSFGNTSTITPLKGSYYKITQII